MPALVYNLSIIKFFALTPFGEKTFQGEVFPRGADCLLFNVDSLKLSAMKHQRLVSMMSHAGVIPYAGRIQPGRPTVFVNTGNDQVVRCVKIVNVVRVIKIKVNIRLCQSK